uniref:Uncharacterized protein n=1 Tax=Anguilla anguilla TaxID=7936 RepID=A0A0E9SQM7_ANGAN
MNQNISNKHHGKWTYCLNDIGVL